MAKAAETASVNFIDAPPLTAAMRMPSMHPPHISMHCTDAMDRAFAQKISLKEMSSICENKA